MKRILIVDDQEENRYLLKSLLAGHGYEAETAIHGADALEKALKNPPGMIISDILMPVMDGFALCRACKKDERLKPIPFIFYTATYTDPRDEKLALGMGADDFIIKPMDPTEFLKRIETVLRTHEGENLITPQKQTGPEEVILKEYNEALIRKLEQKMLHLERANKTLEAEIASRTRAEAALRDSEERYRSLFENSMDGVLLTVPDGEILKANPASCRIFGRSEEEIRKVGREGVVDLSDPRLEKALAERQHTGRFSGEITFVRKDGTKFPGEISSAIFKDATGKLKTSMIIRDITERKTIEEKIVKMNEELEQKVRERTVELHETIAKLEELNRVFVGRELKMAELKKRIEELEKR